MFKTVNVSPKYQLLGYSTNISVQVCSCENRPNVMFLSTVLSFFFFFKKIPVRPAYLWPRPDFPLGGTGVPVAGSARLGPVVVAVFVVDGARGVIVWRLDTADRADLHPRLSTWLAAVLPLPCHPAGETQREREKQEFWGHSKCQTAEVNNDRGGKVRADCV